MSPVALPRVLRRTFTALAAGVLSLLALEGILRCTWTPRAPVLFSGALGTAAGTAGWIPGFQWDPRLLWRWSPGARVLGRYVLNRHGFRGPDVGDDAPPATVRILCIGDSCTFGLGVGEAQTWPRTLERLGRVLLAPGHVEVVNAAIPAYSLFQDLETLRQQLPRLRPDIVVLYDSTYNDATEVAGRSDEEKAVAPWLAPWSRVSRLAAFLGTRRARSRPRDPLEPRVRVAPGQMEELLREAASIGRRDEVPLLLVLPPHSAGLRASLPRVAQYASILERVGREEGLVCVDAAAEFRAWEPFSPFVDPIHPDELGQRLLAWRTLETLLAREILVDPLQRKGLGDEAARVAFLARLLTNPGAGLLETAAWPEAEQPADTAGVAPSDGAPSLAAAWRSLAAAVEAGDRERARASVAEARRLEPKAAALERIERRLGPRIDAPREGRIEGRIDARPSSLAPGLETRRYPREWALRVLDAPRSPWREGPSAGDPLEEAALAASTLRLALPLALLDRRLAAQAPPLDRGIQEAARAVEAEDWGRAIAAWRDVETLGFHPRLARRQRGFAELGAGDLEGACTTFRRAVQGDASDGEAWIGLGQALFRLGDLDEAGTCFREALRHAAQDRRGPWWLGAIQAIRGDLPEARRLWVMAHLPEEDIERGLALANAFRAKRERHEDTPETEEE